jgi:hypothetical protein
MAEKNTITLNKLKTWQQDGERENPNQDIIAFYSRTFKC